MYLIEKVRSSLFEALEIAGHNKELDEITSILKDMKDRLDLPLKVAVVGIIKAGKSTLINALLRKEILVTGRLETTYAVTWFKYGDIPKIIINFKDASSIEGTLGELAYWTVRDEKKNNTRLDEVQYVEIYDNNPLLKEIEIIDTPGLGSTHKIDSENTIDFLGLSSQITTKEASKADAIIYAFSKGVGESDSDVLSAFQNSFANSSPINAFGVLTRVDANWTNIGDPEPFEAASKIADRYKTDPYLHSKLYNILPVSSKIAGASDYLSVEEYDILTRLAALPEERISKLFVNAERFCYKEYEDINISARERNLVFERFDRYGIYLAIRLIQESTPYDLLMEQIYERSHVGDIKKLIQQHFVKRASIIKAYFIITKIKDACQTVINRADRKDSLSCELAQHILSQFQSIEENEQNFTELKVLQYYYNREITFVTEEEEEDFLRLTGEKGGSLEKRLGCQNISIDEMITLANQKAKYWYTKSNIHASKGMYSDVARLLGRTCEHIQYYLKNARI